MQPDGTVPQLVVLAPDSLRGRTISLSGDRLLVGREPACDVRLNDPHISRCHAALRRDGDTFYVQDLGSSGGTLVNEVPATAPTKLKAGDIVAFANVQARYEAAPPAAEQTLALPLQAGQPRYEQVAQPRESFSREIAATKTKRRWLAWTGFLISIAILGVYGYGFYTGFSLNLFAISGALVLLSLAVIVAILVNRRRKSARKRALGDKAPESKKWERPEAWGVAIAILTLVSSTAIGVAQLASNQAVASAGRNSSGSGRYIGQSIPVEGRAASPSDIKAPGVELTNPRAEAGFSSLQNIPETVTFRDLNTIVATSQVPEWVNLNIDPGLSLPRTSVLRLQYLADLMGMQDGKVDLGTIGYVRRSGTRVVAPVFIVNGLQQAINVTYLHVTVRNDQGSKKLLSGNFFSNEDSISVAARSSLFTYLIFTESTPASFPPAHYSTTYSIDWNS